MQGSTVEFIQGILGFWATAQMRFNLSTLQGPQTGLPARDIENPAWLLYAYIVAMIPKVLGFQCHAGSLVHHLICLVPTTRPQFGHQELVCCYFDTMCGLLEPRVET